MVNRVVLLISDWVKIRTWYIRFLLFAVVISGMSLWGVKQLDDVSVERLERFVQQFPKHWYLSVLGNENRYYVKKISPENQPTIDYAGILLELTTSLSMNNIQSFLNEEIPSLRLYDSEIAVRGHDLDYSTLPIETEPDINALLNEQEVTLPKLELPERDANTTPNVYIFHTHTRESFFPMLQKGAESPFHSKANITVVGKKLGAALEKRNIPTLVDSTDFTNILLDRGWKYGRSYDASREKVVSVLKKNEEIDYLIDIHRDTIGKKATTQIIGQKRYARLIFVIGGENERYTKNLAFAKKLHAKLEAKYPGLSRGITIKKGPGVNGVYNQDLREEALVVEFGSVHSTQSELFATTEAFADVFDEVYEGIRIQ
ncbi:MAG: stage II sporulation protein P [Bacilli bacterium]